MNLAEGKVERVIDGDTLWIRFRVRTRKNAPELTQPGGVEAQRSLAARLPRGSTITAEIVFVDSYGRLVAKVSKGGL